MLIVNETVSDQIRPRNNRKLWYFSTVISYIFHPLFIPLYVTYYIAFVNAEFFTGMEVTKKKYVLVWIFINMFFFPAMSVLLLKAVGFIDSILLKKQKDRIIPYIAANLFYFWMFLVFHNNPHIPLIMTSFVLGVFLTSSAALIANIYFKISMHAMGMGGAAGILLVILFLSEFRTGMAVPIMITLILTGMVCSARLLVSDHKPKDIYMGFLLGIIFQFIAAKYSL